MKNVLLFVMALVISACLNAQPSLTSAINPTQWDVFTTLPLDTASVQPGTAGANKTWDFSSLVFIYNPMYESFHAASATLYASFFPNANIASEVSTTSGEYVYHKCTSAGWEIHGYANNLYEFPYSNVQTVFTYPFTYNTQINDSYAGTQTYSGITLTRTGNYSKKGYAYGGLILPTGNFSNILLVQTQDNYIDDLVSNVYTYNVTEYAWYSTAYRFPLLYKRIMEVIVDGVPASTLAIARVSTTVSGRGEFSNDDGKIALYPQPAGDELNIGFHELFNGNLLVECYTLSGQKAATLFNTVAGAETVYTCDISALSAGMYMLKIQAGDKTYVRKFVKR